MTPKRSRGLVAAAVVLAVLLGGSLLAFLLGGDDRPGVETHTAQSPPAPGRSAPADAGPTLATPTSAPVEQPLTAAPAGVRWELFQGLALPVSETDGPTHVNGPVHAGYSRTPTGALLASAQIGGRSLIEPNISGLRRIGEEQLVEGPGKVAYLNLVDSFKDNTPPPGGYAQYVGFRYVAYSPDLAVVSLATRGKTGRLQVGTDTLRWVEGDWRLELPASGLQQPQVVQDLSGYVPWSGVS